MKRLFSSALSLSMLAILAVGCGPRRTGGGNPDLGGARDGGTSDSGGFDLSLPDLGHVDSSAPRCGDFTVDVGEDCDQGAVDTADCDSDCTFPSCGDRHVNRAAGEQCDDGPSGSATCDTSCVSLTPAVCGNGILEGSEACDDNNTFSLDGCSSSCTVESGYACSGEPSVCTMGTTGSTVNVHSGSNSISGSLSTTDPTWTRVGTGCTAGSSSVHYKTYTLHNAGGTTLTLTITATWPGDGFLAAYSTPFSPTSGTVGCLQSNDDYSSTSMSQLTSVSLPGGGSIVLVVTEYSSGSVAGVGSFTIAVDAV